MSHLNKEKKNVHEEAVRQYFVKNGYTSLARGWPDFVFFKYLGAHKDSPMEIIFVEVKRPDEYGIKRAQYLIKKILERFGCDVRVAFGVKQDGSPNYDEIETRVRLPRKKKPVHVQRIIKKRMGITEALEKLGN